MIRIHTSPKFKEEKAYILSVLLTDFLGLNMELNWDETEPHYRIALRDKTLIVEDHFFNTIVGDSYLKKEQIPTSVTKENLLDRGHLPVMYGNSTLVEGDKEITLSIDIFASAFFMLTRWEEYVISEKDQHGRTPSSAQLSVKHGFHRRAIVNEYTELLWSLLKRIGVAEEQRKKRSFAYQFSHDVDHPQLFPSFNGFLKQTGHQLFKRKNIHQALRFTQHYVSAKKDPYDTFDLLMDESEKRNTISQFNVMNCEKGAFEEGYDISSPFIKKLIERIKTRGHSIGFHPSYHTLNDPQRWKSEKERLEKAVGQTISSGRQHYLRFSNPDTWRMWEQNEMTEDATIGFDDEVGFRAGTCYPYHPFDIVERRKLSLLEVPLILMEGALIDRLNTSPDQFVEISNQLKEEVKKYKGTYSVLWHNSTFFLRNYDEYTKVLSSL